MRLEHEVDDLEAGPSFLGADFGIVLIAHSFGGGVAVPLVNQNLVAVTAPFSSTPPSVLLHG